MSPYEFERMKAELLSHAPAALALSYNLDMEGVPKDDPRRVYAAEKAWVEKAGMLGFDRIMGLSIKAAA